jgi:hypothetical protein
MQRNPSSRRPPVQRMTPQQRKVVRPKPHKRGQTPVVRRKGA